MSQYIQSIARGLAAINGRSWTDMGRYERFEYMEEARNIIDEADGEYSPASSRPTCNEAMRRLVAAEQAIGKFK